MRIVAYLLDDFGCRVRLELKKNYVSNAPGTAGPGETWQVAAQGLGRP
jgi:hypothetical protein